MSTVTVDQTTPAGTAGLKLGAYGVQRFLKGLSSTERTAALALMKDAVDLITYHWSGGYSNATSSTQQWATSDFAPTSMGSARTWATIGSHKGLDTMFADLDALIALRPAAKVALVMHDFPQAMLNGATRSTQANLPWPSSTYWGGSYAAALCSEIIARYPGKILAFSYGQELKGISNRTSTTELDAFAAGYTAWATYMHTNHPTIERWYPHLNYFATASLASRQAAVDALIAGGSTLQSADETIINRLMDQVDPTLVDRMTYDCSIVDYNTADTWRGNYAAVSSRVSLEYHLQRVLKAKMTSRWGTQKPLVGVESYFDVNQTEQDWATDAQSAVLQTAIAIWALRGGVTYHNRWEPQGGVPGQESPNGNIASWWNQDGVAFPAWAQIRDLRNTITPGTTLHTVTTDDADVVPVASGDFLYLLNLTGSAKSVTVNATGGTLTSSVGAYGYAIETLPASSPPDPPPDPVPTPDPTPAPVTPGHNRKKYRLLMVAS